ncbi:MAG: archaemetzincin family Zn-dependent metalloprotease [Candidatus Lokiarchaeota archaeon]
MISSSENIIYIQQVGKIDKSIATNLKEDLSPILKKFNLSIEIIPDLIAVKGAEFNESRRQFNASEILKKVTGRAKNKKYYRILGIIDEDIYVKGLNFVFGVATLSRSHKKIASAVISVTRLKESFYNRSKNPRLFRLRILKEALHELGHTFGLSHCENKCIMYFSNHLGDTDYKPAEFCDSCVKNLRYYLKNN